MNRFAAPNITAQPTQETAALPARGAADFPMPLITIYDFWVATWETTLAALATATRSRALSANQAAAHSAVINAERELVTRLLAALLRGELPGAARSPGLPVELQGPA